MQLLRLELKGFKSFADKTIVKFSPGMTAIVGPNGSGKSNITDAMRWVLGESNVRQLRGQKAEDIIFAGTEKRRPMSTAEVTLVFDNRDKRLHPDLAEVALTRRIYRSGDSEFYINKKACRLKDIQALLADTGLGRDSMAIIGQNRVDAILNSKPEERRLIFEEVAGIARFKMNKEESLRRMGQTDRNMERVADLMANLEEQIGPLQEKAAKTEEHGRLSQAKRLYDGALAFHDFKVADRLFTKQENEKIALEQEDIEIETELATVAGSEQSLKLHNDEQQLALRTCEEAVAQAQREEERLQGEKKLVEEQLRSATKEVQDLQYRLHEMEATIAGDGQKVLVHQKLVNDSEADIATQAEVVATKEAAYEMAKAELQTIQAAFQAVQKEVASRHEEQLALVGQVEKYRSELQRVADELGTAQDLVSTLHQEVVDVATEEETALAKQEDLVAKKAKQEATRAEQQQALQALRHSRQQLEKAMQANRRDEQRLEGRLQVLAQWTEQHEGYAEGTRNALQANEPWRRDLHGAIGDLFTVEPKLVTALDIALGGSINHVVASTARAAADCIAYLKRTQGGRVTFLPLETVKGQALQTPALQEPGVLGRAVDCIAFDERYRGVFTYLLGRTLIVDTMERAIELQKQYKQQLRIVTLGGEQFQPGGSLAGGVAKRRKASVMARKEELSTLEAQRVQLQAKLTADQASLQREEQAMDALVATIDAEKDSWDELHTLLLTAQTLCQTLSERKQRKERLVAENTAKVSSLEKAQQTLQEQLAQGESQLRALQTQLDAAGAGAVTLSQLEEAQQAQEMANTAWSEARLAYEQSRQQQAYRQTQIAEWQAAITANTAKMEPLQDQLTRQLELIEITLPQQLQSLTDAYSGQASRAQALQTERQDLYELHSSQKQNLEALSERRKELDTRQKRIQQRLLQMEGQLAKYEMNSTQALAKLEELGFSKEEAQGIQLDGAVADWRLAQGQLQSQLEALGPINPEAVSEYEEALKKQSFYEEQRSDLELAKQQLQSVIAEIDKAMSTQLSEVLEIVGDRFQAVFSQLFGGGTAQIVLTDADNILTSGIDFYIQPPGKKRQQLTLLSGGERALTVIALLFSFLDYRPAPFCVLDEVDAALDEANVERFGSYLQRLGADTQFIVVSHRKRTMEAALVLQGVTMVERGVSRLLTVAFDDIEEDM